MASSLHRIINSVAQPWKEKQINVRWSHLLLVICWFILKLLGSPANYNRRHVTSRIFRRVTRKDQKDKQPYPKNPAGKSRPQIHMTVGGNPGGRHAISTPTDTKHTRRTSFTADTLNVLVHGAHTHIRPLTGVTKGLRDTSENMIMLLVLEPALFACTFGRPFPCRLFRETFLVGLGERFSCFLSCYANCLTQSVCKLAAWFQESISILLSSKTHGQSDRERFKCPVWRSQRSSLQNMNLSVGITLI